MQILNSLTVSELIDMPINSEKILIDGVIKGDTVSLLSADPKAGKTALALQMADAIASSSSNILFPKTANVHVAYFFLDDSVSNAKERILKMKIEKNQNIQMIFLKNTTIEDLKPVIHKMKKADGDLGFVVIDMLNDVRKIDTKKEYSNEEIKQDILKLREIAESNHLAILVLHHNGKKEQSNKNNKALGGIQLTGTINGSILSLVRSSLQEKYATLEISGRNVTSHIMHLEFDSSTARFSPAPEEVKDLEKDLVKIINFITIEKEFLGTCQQLAAKLSLLTNPSKIGVLLGKERDSLLENGIWVKKRKSNGKRLIDLHLDPKFDFDLAGSEGLSYFHDERRVTADPKGGK